MTMVQEPRLPLRERVAELLATLQTWPWLDTLRTLRARFREDRLGLTASSLTFTTLIALVPLFTVMLAIFSAFPIFSNFQGALEKYFLQALVPDAIAKPVLTALTQFSGKAKRLGTVGLVVLVVTALALMFTVDRALNGIWRVRRPRPIGQRVLVYWAGLTLGPLLLGISLWIPAWFITASRGMAAMPGGTIATLLNLLEFGLLAFGMAALFHYVPNTHVRWRHALAGGFFVSIGIEVAKKVLAWYVASVPTYSAVYGAFATAPILLLWIYTAWVIVLLGAVIAAYAPSLSRKVVRALPTPGHRFALALDVLRRLNEARGSERRGLALLDIAEELRTDPLQIEPLLDAMVDLDWVARLEEDGMQRHVLLADPAETLALPLLDELLLHPAAGTQAFRAQARFGALRLSELL